MEIRFKNKIKYIKHFALRLRLAGCKIFSSENIFGKRKYFQVFGYIMKIVLENVFGCFVAF